MTCDGSSEPEVQADPLETAGVPAKIEEARQSAVKEAVELSTSYMNVLYETKIEPQFKLLAEGQETLLETLAPKSRVEAVEEELAFLKTVVSALNKEVQELKQAI